jgi:uncharacterized NAD(P)/FAD-binding protein YdhS
MNTGRGLNLNDSDQLYGTATCWKPFQVMGNFTVATCTATQLIPMVT